MLFSRQREHEDAALMADLLESLQRMVWRGHLPSPVLLVRLTDGRIRLHYALDSRAEASVELRRICNECGPARTALWVSVALDGAAVQLAVEPLMPLAGGKPSQAYRVEARLGGGFPQALAGEVSTGAGVVFSASSRNRAMREASLGMTTGLLPNLDSILLSSGARSWSV